MQNDLLIEPVQMQSKSKLYDFPIPSWHFEPSRAILGFSDPSESLLDFITKFGLKSCVLGIQSTYKSNFEKNWKILGT